MSPSWSALSQHQLSGASRCHHQARPRMAASTRAASASRLRDVGPL
nr:MAG TPA: hypothetical protein [Caudoviricetes sp.]